MVNPNLASQSNSTPYLVASGVILLLGSVMILGIIMLRPSYDPLIVIGAVAGLLAPTLAAIQAYNKAQETHLSVNSRLDAWMKEHGQVKLMEGMAQERSEEQARVLALGLSPMVPIIAPIAPAPVVQQNEVIDTRLVEVSKQVAQEIKSAVSSVEKEE